MCGREGSSSARRSCENASLRRARPTLQDGKRISCRPDLVALSALMKSGAAVNQSPLVGHVPGIPIGRRFYSRAEVAAVGLHRHWLNGISFAPKGSCAAAADAPVAVSIVVSGGYEDDVDDGVHLVYTGQGGNDLLGRKHQVKDQTWTAGNAALRNAVERRVPVRVIRGALTWRVVA